MRPIRTIIAALLVVSCLLPFASPAASVQAAAAGTAVFSDIRGHWAEQTIGKLAAQGLLDGFPDGTFRPDDTVTADQFIKILLLSFSELYPNGERSWTSSFLSRLSPAGQRVIQQDYRDFTFRPNTVGYWAKPYIDLAGDLNLIGKSQFADYKASLKREDVAEILYYTIRETEYVEDETYSRSLASAFGDFQSATARQQKFIAEATAKGIMEGYPNGYFGVGRYVTRAEALRILERLTVKSARVDAQGGDNTYVKVVPTRDGSYKKLVFPDRAMMDAYGVMEEAGKLRGTNYDLEETTLRLFKDADAKAAALKGGTDAERFANETTLWLDPKFNTYGVTIRLQDGVLARNTESIRKFTDFIFGYNADTFYNAFANICGLIAAGKPVENATLTIGDYAVETSVQPDGQTVVFSILRK
ncbi:S-layer homology domain-containing protein [Paenibacillus cymbidii]|uniref:S-layer homology domain-containing protein n=1 Tax=Paenibacillus cymbidii TaxID=1639034 RepID=UPI0010800537|nr:S-layer homology domain-containing protein [Paenibacillus cymbidii]